MSFDFESFESRAILPLQGLLAKAQEAGNHGVENLSRQVLGEISKAKKALEHLEIHMGKAAQAITELQGELTTAQANAYDAADLAAIQGVLGTPAAGTPAAARPAAGTAVTPAPTTRPITDPSAATTPTPVATLEAQGNPAGN